MLTRSGGCNPSMTPEKGFCSIATCCGDWIQFMVQDSAPHTACTPGILPSSQTVRSGPRACLMMASVQSSKLSLA